MSTSLATLALLASGFFIYRQLVGGPSTQAPQKAYYTIDEGANVFVDSISQLPPFDHDGKPALRVHIFSIKGKQVTGYLERYPEKNKTMIEEAQNDPNRRVQAAGARIHGSEVRAIDGTKWYPVDSDQGNAIATPPTSEIEDVFEKFP